LLWWTIQDSNLRKPDASRLLPHFIRFAQRALRALGHRFEQNGRKTKEPPQRRFKLGISRMKQIRTDILRAVTKKKRGVSASNNHSDQKACGLTICNRLHKLLLVYLRCSSQRWQSVARSCGGRCRRPFEGGLPVCLLPRPFPRPARRCDPPLPRCASGGR